MTPPAPLSQTLDGPALHGFVAGADEDDVTRQLVRPQFDDEAETMLLLGFDSFERLVHIERINGDASGRCTITPRRWRALLDCEATAIMMAHNHVSGDARPSMADRRMTRDAAIFLRTAGLELIDHLILVPQGHFSFRHAAIL